MVLLRIVDDKWCKELGRQTGRRSSTIEQTPLASREEGEKKSLMAKCVIYCLAAFREMVGRLAQQCMLWNLSFIPAYSKFGRSYGDQIFACWCPLSLVSWCETLYVIGARSFSRHAVNSPFLCEYYYLYCIGILVDKLLCVRVFLSSLGDPVSISCLASTVSINH